jgi:hypothetical protein
MSSIQIFWKDGKYDGWVVAGKRPPDWKDYFPKKYRDILPEEKLDEYGNGQYEVRVKDEIKTDNATGEYTEKTVTIVKKRLVPTAEQIARRKKQLFKQHYAYDRDDEIALVKDAINALQVGKEIPMDYTQMELDRAAAKQEADNVIEADLFKIAEEHKDVSR